MKSSPDILNEVFSPSIIKAWRATANPSEQLRTRLLVITGNPPQLPELQVCRDAWGKYLRCAFQLGFLDGALGADLRARRVGLDDDLFSSAMSECFVAWFLAERLSMVVSPRPEGRSRRVLEMTIASKYGDINVEVKALNPRTSSLRRTREISSSSSLYCQFSSLRNHENFGAASP